MVFVWLPPDDSSQAGRVSQKSFYGTRGAALNRTTAYTCALFQNMGVVQGKANPLRFNAKLQVRIVVHGDDLVSEGPEEGLLAVDATLRYNFEIKTEFLDPEKRRAQALKVLDGFARGRRTQSRESLTRNMLSSLSRSCGWKALSFPSLLVSRRKLEGRRRRPGA